MTVLDIAENHKIEPENRLSEEQKRSTLSYLTEALGTLRSSSRKRAAPYQLRISTELKDDSVIVYIKQIRDIFGVARCDWSS